MEIIFAIDKNGGYAKSGTLPWKNSEDMAHFKNTTTGKTVIMGRKTWESLPRKPLPNRINIVISKTLVDSRCTVLPSLCDEGIVIGGNDLVVESLKNFKVFYLTIFDDSYDCDQFITFDYNKLKLVESRAIKGGTINTFELP